MNKFSPKIRVSVGNLYKNNKKGRKCVPAIEQYSPTNRKRIETFCVLYPFFSTSTAFVDTKSIQVICLALFGVIFLLRKSDIVPDGRSDIIFALKPQRAKRISRPKDISRTCAYHSPKANRVGAPAIEQVRQFYSPEASYTHFVRDIAFGSDMRYARLM